MNYSVSIANQLSTYLTNNDWNFDFDEEKGLFRFALKMRNKLRSIDYNIKVRDDSYIVYATSPISPDEDDPEQMSAVAEFVCRANFGLPCGCFEFDFTDGETRYRYAIDCRERTLSNDIIEDSIRTPSVIFKRYGNGLIDVIFNQTSPEQAVKTSEKGNVAVIRHFLTEVMQSENPDQELMARLSACLENMGEHDNEDMTIKVDPFASEGGEEL